MSALNEAIVEDTLKWFGELCSQERDCLNCGAGS
jgi:hypothetical protein